jgi:uncharacterized protein
VSAPVRLVETAYGGVSTQLDETPGARALFILAHGAGGSLADRGVLAASEAAQRAGCSVLRFNFPYRERKSARPDPMPVLMECIARVAEHTRDRGTAALILGGRSMGGRAASMLVAGGFPCDGLLLLAYPLHPPGQTEKLRDSHLPDIRVPVLCVNGTRDAFCERELMERTLTRVGDRWTMHWVAAADHGFRVPRSSGRTDADVREEIATAAGDWLDTVIPASRTF